MTTIVLQTMKAWASCDNMVSYAPFSPSIEMQQAATIAEALTTGRAMIERAKQSGIGATLLVSCYGRKPRGFDAIKHQFAINTFN